MGPRSGGGSVEIDQGDGHSGAEDEIARRKVVVTDDFDTYGGGGTRHQLSRRVVKAANQGCRQAQRLVAMKTEVSRNLTVDEGKDIPPNIVRSKRGWCPAEARGGKVSQEPLHKFGIRCWRTADGIADTDDTVGNPPAPQWNLIQHPEPVIALLFRPRVAG